MNKYLGAGCSCVASVFAIISFSLGWLNFSLDKGAEIGDVCGWCWLTENIVVQKYIFYKVVACILIFVAILLIISAVLVILQNSYIIGTYLDFEKLNNWLLTIFAVLGIIMIVGTYMMSKEVSYVNVSLSLGAWMLPISAGISCLVAWINSSSYVYEG